MIQNMPKTKIVAGYIDGKTNTLEDNLNKAIKELVKHDEHKIKKIDLQTFPSPHGCIAGTALIVYEDFDVNDCL